MSLYLFLQFLLFKEKISKLKNLIFKKIGYTSIEQPESQYFVGAKPFYDGAPTTCAPEAPAALALMAPALALICSGSGSKSRSEQELKLEPLEVELEPSELEL
jgi:hypothetical protein